MIARIGPLLLLLAAPGVAQTQYFVPPGQPVDSSPQELLVLDINADAHPDFVTLNPFSNDISVVLAHPSASYWPAVNYPFAEDFAGHLTAGHLNDDAHPDILLVQNGAIVTFLNLGDGSLAEAAMTETLPDPYDVATGDLNADGRTDVVICDQDFPQIYVHLANPDGSFASPIQVGTFELPRLLIIGDFTTDGLNDILVGDPGVNAVFIMANLGNDTFGHGPLDPVGELSDVITDDLDGDDDLDLVVASYNALRTFFNDGAGSFEYDQLYAPFDQTYGLMTADFTTDDIPDVAIIADSDDVFHILANDGTGKLTPLGFYPTSSYMLYAADIDGDDDLDLIHDGFLIHKNLGEGTLDPNPITVDAPSPISPKYVDADLDGDLDIVAASTSANVVMTFDNDGEANFPTFIYPAGEVPQAMRVTDLDHDGLDDVAIASKFTIDGNLFIYASTGDALELRDSTFAGAQPRAIASADFNDDGHTDLAVAAASTDEVVILLNDGDATFDDTLDIPVPIEPVAIDAGDLNGDEMPDLLVGSYEPFTIAALLATGKSTFADPIVTVMDAPVTHVRLAHINPDQHLDAVVVTDTQALALFGNGDGTFAAQQVIGDVGTADVDLADFDADDDADLLVATNAFAKLFLNDGAGHFDFEANIILPNDVVEVAFADLDGAATLDLVVTTTRNTYAYLDPFDDPAQVLHFGSDVTLAALGRLDAASGIDLAVVESSFNFSRLWTIYSAPCPADLNVDGNLNILDFVAFQLAWQSAAPVADCDADSDFTILDFVCFHQLFQQGCPQE